MNRQRRNEPGQIAGPSTGCTKRKSTQGKHESYRSHRERLARARDGAAHDGGGCTRITFVAEDDLRTLPSGKMVVVFVVESRRPRFLVTIF